MLDKRVIFHSRFTFATILLIAVTSSYVITTWNRTLCRGETNSYPKSIEGVIIDVYTLKGGRGIGQQSGAFRPGEVLLYAQVINNSIPLVDKPVAFQIRGPINQYRNISIVKVAWTNASGIATTSFDTGYPVEHVEEIIFGTWNILAIVEFDGLMVVDTVTFEVGWIVEILSVEAGTLLNETYWIPRANFTKKRYVDFKITVKNIDLTEKKVWLTIVCYDKGGVPFARGFKILIIPEKTIEGVFIVNISIPKWAIEGEAEAYSNALDNWPMEGGMHYCPEKETSFIIMKEINDATPPLIDEAFREPEIVQPNQEVMISVNATDSQSGVQGVILYYHASTDNTWISVKMNKTTANTFKGNITGFPLATNISYVIIAYDYAGNFAIDDNAGQYYVYMVVPEFPSWTLILSVLTVSAVAIIICKRKYLKKVKQSEPLGGSQQVSDTH